MNHPASTSGVSITLSDASITLKGGELNPQGLNILMRTNSSTKKLNKARILFVDDDPAVLKSIKRLLHAYGMSVTTANNAELGMEILRTTPPFQVVISDYLMSGTNGDQFLRAVAESWPDTRRIILSAFADRDILLAAINEGKVHRYVMKPWENDELIEGIMEMLEDFKTVEHDRNIIKEAALKNQMLAMTNQQLEALIKERTADLVAQQHQLNQTNLRLRQLTVNMEQLREQERHAIAREMHDELAQSLSAIKLEIAAILPTVEKNKPIVNKLTEIKKRVDVTINSVQSILMALRSQVLQELGLKAALDWLISDFRRRSGIKTMLSARLGDKPLPSEISTCLFRVTQEALTNISRHAKASQVSVLLRRDLNHCLLTIVDNGIGISANRLNAIGSFGLLGMQERVALCNGHFKIERATSGGTLLDVDIPLIADERALL